MAAPMSQKEYLKKYLSGGDDGEKKKKKKKKKDKSAMGMQSKGMRIIEDTFDIKNVPFGEGEDDDNPTIAEVTYEDESMKVMEEFQKSKKWKKMGDDQDEPNGIGKMVDFGVKKQNLDVQILKQRSKPDMHTQLKRQRHDSDASPPRRLGHNSDSSPPRRKRYDSDASPPSRQRHDSDTSPRRQRHDSDASPPRRKQLVSDASPPRRQMHSAGVSPPKRQRHDSGTSPLRGNRHDSDTSLPRRQRHDSDASPPRRQRHDSDASPPRRQRHDSDTSPPRRQRHDSDSDASSPGRQKHDSDASPPRRQRNDSDASPPRRQRNDSAVATTWPDFTQPLSTYYWGRQLLRYHSWVEFDGAWIDMNEPSNFWSGSYDGCGDNNLEHPPFLPHVHGGILYYHTICMTARHYFGRHYSIHNLYGFTEAIATNKALQIIRGKRPFIISRSSFAGLGHYSGHWTGDIWSDWFNLWQSISGILNFNMFGIPMVGADICGFNGNVTASLCLRWMQLGAFYPFSRNHNTDTAYDQDPVALGQDVVEASRKALEIRYLLLPYLYSLFFNAHLTGEPVARPLFFQFHKDERTYGIDTQFMWGSGLMIAPALKENVTEVKAYIPEGRWYDWYSKTIIEGKGSYEMLAAPSDVIPLLIRGGTIMPVQVPAVTTTRSRKNDMGIIAALDESGHAAGEWFWDDGESLDTAENMNYTHVVFSAEPGNVSVNVTLAAYQEPANLGYFEILGVDGNVTAVYVDNKKVTFSYEETTKVLSAVGLKKSLLVGFSISWE